MKVSKNKIILYGADSYIGSRLSKRICLKYQVLEYSGTHNSKMKFFDLRYPDLINHDMDIEENDIAIFMAGISSPDICENNYEETYKINVKGTKYLINKILSRGARVIFFSSDTVYGNELGRIFDENSKKNPIGAYGKMKSSVEDEFLKNPKFLTLRLSYIFSFEDKFTQYLLTSSNKETKEVYHPFSRSVVYIEDLISAIEIIINKWPENNIINVCGDSLISRVDIANAIKESMTQKLSFDIINPGENFYKIRPPIIHTHSLFLKDLLGREIYTLKESINKEKELLK